VRGRLLASTDRGHIYCFTPDAAEPRMVRPAGPIAPGYPDVRAREQSRQSAARIVKEADVTRGYCLVLGSGDGRLACELARLTRWQIVGREPDADQGERSRKRIDSGGVGDRVTIHQGALDALPYTDHAFNVVVTASLTGTGTFTGSREE